MSSVSVSSRFDLKNGFVCRSAIAVLAGMIIACRGADANAPVSRILGVGPETPRAVAREKPSPAPPSIERFGTVTVRIKTSGSNIDPDGYVVRTDGEWDYTAEPQPIAINGTLTLKFIPAGWHTVTLKEVASNCDGASLQDREIFVVADSVTRVKFDVFCKTK